MTEKEEYTSLVGVKEFVEKRAAQIADLLKVVDNSRLVSGEVTKGPRTAAQRLPRHMRRRAMAYEIRRFPRGLRNFASAFLISNHRKKPPCRFFRRRSRNLLLNYIRRQRKAVWLETHIWHAKRFHMVERWGYRLPDRSFQRNFRPIYRNSMRHCTVRDKSYLNCFLISGPSQPALLALLKPFCSPAVSPTFAFKSSLGGLYEVSTLLYEPNSYPDGLIGPARFQWTQLEGRACLALWIHPSCRKAFLPLLVQSLAVEKEERMEEGETEAAVPRTFEEWKLRSCQVRTDVYRSKDGSITVEDLKEQLVRMRFYGPKSLDVIRASLQLSEEAGYRENHSEWAKLSSIDDVPDGRVFSLLVEDPRISRPRGPRVPPAKEKTEEDWEPVEPVTDFWSREKRLEALRNRLTDQEMNSLKGRATGPVSQTPAKIPVLVVIRRLATGRQEALEGVELVAPTGFGRDLWVAAQLRTAHASGLRDDGAAHLEAGCLSFPADYLDSAAGRSEEARVCGEKEAEYGRRPHNRRVQYWKKLAVKFPLTFEFGQLVSQWSGMQSEKPYLFRDRRALIAIDDWMRGKAKKPDALLTCNKTAMVAVRLSCLARGRPRRFGLVCLPTKEDLAKIRECQYAGKKFKLVETGKDVKEEVTNGNAEEEEEQARTRDDKVWKDIVSLDPATREKPIPLKPLFSDSKNVDRTMKRRLLNRKKKEAKRRRVEVQQARIAAQNREEDEKTATAYRNAALRETLGRVVRGDYSFTQARGIGLAMVPVAALDGIVAATGVVLVRNSTSKYYHPAAASLLKQVVEL